MKVREIATAGIVVVAILSALTGYFIGSDPDDYSAQWLKDELSKVDINSEIRNNEVYIIMPTITFSFGSYEINPETDDVIKRAVTILNMRQVVHTAVLIEGHASREGDEIYNLNLSELRALAIEERMLEHGMKAERIFSVGKGELHADETGYGRVVFAIVYEEK